MVSIPTDKFEQFLAYFEEPEPGVPVGYSGWYHSGGRFELQTPEQAFAPSSERAERPVRPEVAGPFTARADALSSLMAALPGQHQG
jgi:hypothetical protein